MNIYAFAHKGIRNLLSQVAFLAGKTNYANAEQLDELKLKTQDLLGFLDLHAQAEEGGVEPHRDPFGDHWRRYIRSPDDLVERPVDP